MGEFELMNKTLSPGDPVQKPPKPKSQEKIMKRWGVRPDCPLVSILCITYNHAAYIEDALNSFLAQETDFPFEIWVHDDASTDGTREILEYYQAEYPRLIKLVLQEVNKYSQGYRPLRFLREVCSGAYCALCEGDDYWLGSEKLARQVAALQGRPQAGLSIHPAYMVDVKKNRVTKMFGKGCAEKVLDVSGAVASADQYSPTASYLFRTKDFQSMPNWFFEARDLPFGDYFLETILGRNGLVYLPDVYCVYRRNVIGSYTIRFQEMDAKSLLAQMVAVIKYTNYLQRFCEISEVALRTRRINIYLGYLNTALARNSLKMYRHIIVMAGDKGEALPPFTQLAASNLISFKLFKYVRRMYLIMKVLLRRLRQSLQSGHKF